MLQVCPPRSMYISKLELSCRRQTCREPPLKHNLQLSRGRHYHFRPGVHVAAELPSTSSACFCFAAAFFASARLLYILTGPSDAFSVPLLLLSTPSVPCCSSSVMPIASPILAISSCSLTASSSRPAAWCTIDRLCMDTRTSKCFGPYISVLCVVRGRERRGLLHRHLSIPLLSVEGGVQPNDKMEGILSATCAYNGAAIVKQHVMVQAAEIRLKLGPWG